MPRLLSANTASKGIREKGRIMIYSSCLDEEHPDIVREQSDGYYPLSVCMEESLFNVVALKVASILVRVRLTDVKVLTVDGSPHCIQLHHAVEEAFKISGSKCSLKHLIVSNGRVIEVSKEVVKACRYLSKVSRILSSYKLSDSI